ncbi:acetyl esterase [Sphingomonas sp. UYAg733]
MTDNHDDHAGIADRSMLDAQTIAILARLEESPFLDPAMTPLEMRAAFDAFYSGLPIPSGPIASADDMMIDGPAGPLALRIYTPEGRPGAARPLVAFYHGGGAMMGGIESYDGVCRRLCAQSGAIIAATTYRLAPEHKFPAATDDAWATLNWIADNALALGADPDKLVIMGESGGGGLAAGCAIRARDSGGPQITLQILVNPALGTLGASRSMKRYSRGFFFEPEALDWIYSQYLGDPNDLSDPLVSPILVPDVADLPTTFLVIAGHDILRDDIVGFAERLSAAGVAVATRCYDTTIHGFTVMAGAIDAGLNALDACAERIRAL